LTVVAGAGPRCASSDLAELSPLVGAPHAGQDHEEDEGTEGGGDADDEAFVVVDPGFDFLAEVGSFALALLMKGVSVMIVSRVSGMRGVDETYV
jgi:hypothetical protein